MVDMFLKIIIMMIGICLMGCSQKTKKEFLEESVPDVIFGSDKVEQFKTFDEFSEKAQKSYRSHKFDSLLELVNRYESHFQELHDQENLRLFKGMALLGQKKIQESQSIFESLQKSKDPDIKGKAHFYAGEAFRLNKDFSKALLNYHQAYALLKTSEIDSSIADTYVSMGNYSQAMQYYQKVLERDPHSVNDRLYLSMIQYKNHQYTKSENNLKKVLQDNPRSTQAYYYLSLIAQQRKDQVNYYYYLSRAKLLKRDYRGVGDLLMGKPEIYKDIRLFEIAIVSYLRSSQMNQAVFVYHQGLKTNKSFINNENIKIYQGVLVVYPQKGLNAAIDYFSHLYQEHPKSFNVITAYAGYLAQKNKNDKKIVKLYQEALAVEPENTEYRYKLAVWYQDQQQPLLAQLQYGILYYYQDQKQLALEAFEHLQVDNHLEMKELYYYLWKIYKDLKDQKKADIAYKKYLKLNSKS